MSSNERKLPEVATTEMVAVQQANYKVWMEWDNKDDQAYGSILLQVNPSVAAVTTANPIWWALQTTFGQTGPLAIFTEFKSVISQKISVANPTIDIMVMNKNFWCLTAAQVAIPEIVQAMILLNAIPKEYNEVAQTMLQTQEQSKLTFNYVRDAILMEHSRLKAGQPVKQTASKLSTVKQKGANPKWRPKQQQQLSDKKDEEESEKKPCAHGHCSGCKVKKHQAKQADDYEEDEAESSQLTSSAFMAAPFTFMTVTGHGAVIPPVQPKHLN